MKKITAVLLVLVLMLSLAACEKEAETDSITQISFSAAVSLDQIRTLDGKRVSAIGYMATLSPVSGNYMYLMNMPYQSCPFCVPNTQALSNTLAVYAPEGDTFDFTDQAIRVTGTMKVEDYTDDFGYEYNYRIVDAVYEVVDLSTLSETYSLWQTISQDGIVSDVYASFDYLNFLCCWPDYSVNYTADDGTNVFYYLYPGDVENYLADDGLYGYKTETQDDYYPTLASRARAFGGDVMEQLGQILDDCDALKTEALAELSGGAYQYDAENDVYILNRGEELYNAWYELYCRFSEWLANWTM